MCKQVDSAGAASGQIEPPIHPTVNGWLLAAFEKYSGAQAVLFKDEVLTYQELGLLSGRIAAFLASHGIGRGDAVGVMLDRSAAQIAVILGILRAGAAYVPLDPAYPSKRLETMVQDAGMRALFVHEACGLSLEVPLVWQWGDILPLLERFEPLTAADEVNAEDTAYIVSTSGSTGRPKGIEMPHRALANLIEWQLERVSFRPGARVLQYSSISFDVSFQEIAATLASGGTLVLVDEACRRDPGQLLEYIAAQRIERLFLPYVALRSLVQTANRRNTYPETLSEIITAGEQLRIDDEMRTFFRHLKEATLDNQYGPSETHVITANLLTGNPADWADLPAIGRPIKNCQALILTAQGELQENKEIGELYLGGRNLALGYKGRADLTRQVFVQNPLGDAACPVLYKTGDLASYQPDGSIRFHGRADLQVKIRGHRIEPGEINNLAAAFSGVAQALTCTVNSGEQLPQLVLYYTEEEPGGVNVPQLWNYLQERLPEYMVPAFLVPLDEVPLTPSGKTDLKALPKPSVLTSRYADVPLDYRTETEERLAEMFGRVLGFSGIPAAADFFELGGDSLRAVYLFQRISEGFGAELPLAVLAESPTVRELAAVIDGRNHDDLSAYRALKRLRKGRAGQTPLFLVHGGLGNLLVFGGFAEQLGNDMPIYGFQWLGWDGKAGPGHVENMARTYADELISFHGRGPVRLGGYCIGGLIMLEMVKMLRDAGVEVLDPLFAVDSPNLAAATYFPTEPWDNPADHAVYNRLMGEMNGLCEIPRGPEEAPVFSAMQMPGGLSKQLRRVPGLLPLIRRAKGVRIRLHKKRQMNRINRILTRGETIPYELRESYCREMLIRAAHKYKGRVYSGDMLYFRSACAIGRYFALSGWWADPYLGFAELCTGRFEPHVLEGDHVGIMGHSKLAQTVTEKYECAGADRLGCGPAERGSESAHNQNN